MIVANLLGANILLLARGREGLEKAQKEILAARKVPTQAIEIISVDLIKPDAVSISTYRIELQLTA